MVGTSGSLLSADLEVSFGLTSLLPNTAELAVSTVSGDPLLGGVGVSGVSVSSDVGRVVVLVAGFSGNDWSLIDNLVRTGVAGGDLGSGELEGELLSLSRHVGNLVIHASVSLGVSKGGTANQCNNKNTCELHF